MAGPVPPGRPVRAGQVREAWSGRVASRQGGLVRVELSGDVMAVTPVKRRHEKTRSAQSFSTVLPGFFMPWGTGLLTLVHGNYVALW